MLAIIYCCYWTPKSQGCSGIDLITISREHSKKELALGGELDSKVPFNAQIQEVNKNQKIALFCYFLFPTRYFFLSLQGTYGKSLISKAQKIDQLPKDKRDLAIQSWRSKHMPTPVPGKAQPTHRPLPPVPEQDLRASASRSSSTPKQKCKEDGVLCGERSSRDHMRDDPCSADSSAKLSSGDHLLLGPRSTMASGACSSGQANVYQGSSRGSHRRSQSSLTIWVACRNVYKLRGGCQSVA